MAITNGSGRMPYKHSKNRFTCDYGSGARLGLGVNNGHVVIAIDDDGKRCSIALTPDTLDNLAARLQQLAASYREYSSRDGGR